MAVKKTFITIPPVLDDQSLFFLLVDMANCINDLKNGLCPDRPMFSAVPASAQNNIPINTWTDVAFGTEKYDIGSNFASPSFTAPFDGKHFFDCSIEINNIDTAANYYQLRFNHDGTMYYENTIDPGVLASDPVYWPFKIAESIDMNKDDTIKVQIYQGGGTAQADIQTYSHFLGFLEG